MSLLEVLLRIALAGEWVGNVVVCMEDALLSRMIDAHRQTKSHDWCCSAVAVPYVSERQLR
jgi:hypothetical protein